MAKVVGTRQRLPRTYEFEVDVTTGCDKHQVWKLPAAETFVVLSWEGTVLHGQPTKADLAQVRCGVSCQPTGEGLELAADLITPVDSVAASRIDRIEAMLGHLLKEGNPDPLAKPEMSVPDKAHELAWVKAQDADLVAGMRRLGWKSGMFGIDYRKLLTPTLVRSHNALALTVAAPELDPGTSFRFRLTAFGIHSRDLL